MRGRAVVLAFAVASAPAAAQDEPRRTAEEFIEHAREVYAVGDEPEVEPCPEATAAEIVVCRQYQEYQDEPGILSPSEQALVDGVMPPDRIPSAPNVFGIPPCKSYTFCAGIGRDPPPVLLIDLEAIPEALTAEEAAHIFRVEDAPSPAAASPAAVP